MNEVYTGKMSRMDFIEYAEVKGASSAADLLLLCGYDGFDGTVEQYDKLMNEFYAEVEEENG